MRNFFLRISIFFCLKIFILDFLGLTYYIFSTVIKSDTMNEYLEKEEEIKTEGKEEKNKGIELKEEEDEDKNEEENKSEEKKKEKKGKKKKKKQ